MSASGSPRARALTLGALAALGLVAWGGGLTHGLQGDDAILLRSYLRVRDHLPPLYAYFLAPSWGVFYRPLAAYFYDRLFALCWPATWPSNLLALGVHVAGAAAVVRLARLCGLRTGPAWLAGAIFVSAPLHAEPVLWTAALHGMIENVLGLWAVVLLVEGRRGAWRPGRIAGGVACYLLAVAMKESGMVVVGIVGLHDLLWRKALHDRARRPGALAAVYVPLVAGAAGVLLMRRAAYGGFTLFASNTFDFGYLSIAVARTLIACFSPLPWRVVEQAVTPAVRTAVALPLFLALPGAAAVVLLLRRARAALWLWGALWGTVVPLAAVAVVPAERHLYLSSAFAAVLVALALGQLAEAGPRTRRIAVTVGAVWLAVQLVSARQRLAAWHAADTHVRAVLDQTALLLPRVEPNALLVYLGVPDEVDGALVFRFGNINAFTRARYGSDEMLAQMVCTPAELPPRLLEAPGMLRFTIGARGSHVYWPERMHGGAFARYDELLVERARLGKSFLLKDWIEAGKPAYVLVYDVATRRLRLGDAALRADMARHLLWIDYEGKTPLERYAR